MNYVPPPKSPMMDVGLRDALGERMVTDAKMKQIRARMKMPEPKKQFKPTMQWMGDDAS